MSSDHFIMSWEGVVTFNSLWEAAQKHKEREGGQENPLLLESMVMLN